MIAEQQETEEADSTPTDDHVPFVAVYVDEDEVVKYWGDEIAEIITLPGGMVQAIDMEGERHDPVDGFILAASGCVWSIWTKHDGSDETTHHTCQTGVQHKPNGEVVLMNGGVPEFVGTSIRRIKRTSLIESK